MLLYTTNGLEGVSQLSWWLGMKPRRRRHSERIRAGYESNVDSTLVGLVLVGGYMYLLVINWRKGKRTTAVPGLLLGWIPLFAFAAVVGSIIVAKPNSQWFDKYLFGSNEEAKSIARFPKDAASVGRE